MVPRTVLTRPFNNITTANNSNFTKKVNTIKGNKGNAVKASACWVWRPKHSVLDHISRNNDASMSFKRFDYIDAQGRSNINYDEIDEGFGALGARMNDSNLAMIALMPTCVALLILILSRFKEFFDAGFKPSGEEEKKDVEDLGNEKLKHDLVAKDTFRRTVIDYNEVFAPVARIKAIREKFYVCQPPGFEDPDFPNRVYKVEKALYGLHQALRDWYETLSTYLLDNGFQRGKIDKTLFIRRVKSDILLISWQCKKQTVVVNSTTKAEYIAVPIDVGQTKHIEIRHHFIRDSYEMKLNSDDSTIYIIENVADLAHKRFDVSSFNIPIC
ncbi:putative ribonuclease H-like domain-containing protein [Tanacetum coccineum]|uniref:Ribonuclease H-like domain-containing protein n=1 Tax=Tanacetum coccineum TaxID=301880 RepID=A0ABQ5HUW4_9ASTR